MNAMTRITTAVLFSGTLLATGDVRAQIVPQAAGAPQIAGDDRAPLTINDPRPLMYAALALEAKYGVVVTYEDPRYAYAADLVDIRHPDVAKAQPGLRAFSPVAKTLVLDRAAWPAAASPDEVVALAQGILKQHHASGGGAATFRLKRTGDAIHIIPSKARDEKGRPVDQESILDVSIAPSAQHVNGFKALMAVAESVGQRTGTQVLVGNVPLNLLTRYDCDLGGAEEEARTVLTRVLEGTGRKLSWQLGYTPTGPKGAAYYLSIHAVDNPQRPTGTPAVRRQDRRPQ